MLEVVHALSPVDRQACYDLRRTVFVEEQGVAEDEEWDGLDDQCSHFLARDAAGVPLGTARLKLLADGVAKAQRVAVVASARRTGVGRALMSALEAEAVARGCREVTLGAQVTALEFYAALGYQVYGEPFLDAGIPHRAMRKSLG